MARSSLQDFFFGPEKSLKKHAKETGNRCHVGGTLIELDGKRQDLLKKHWYAGWNWLLTTQALHK